MTDHDSDYHSSEDEDYVPDEGAEDVECSSGDEVDEVNESESIVTNKRKSAGKECVNTCGDGLSSVDASTNCADGDDAAAAFMALMAEKDPILGRPRAEAATNAIECATPCKSSEATVSSPSSSQTKDANTENTTVITEVFDFAGDEVKVQREVSAEEAKQLEAKQRRKEEEKSRKPAQKRLGIGAALTLLAKKPKMSVLDKSNLDWDAFKAEKNLQEELTTFNRGKNGYLEKMEFLTRADYKEFEKEKALRNASRKPI